MLELNPTLGLCDWGLLWRGENRQEEEEEEELMVEAGIPLLLRWRRAEVR